MWWNVMVYAAGQWVFETFHIKFLEGRRERVFFWVLKRPKGWIM